MFPTIAEYNQAIQLSADGTFRSLSNLSFIPSRTIPVKIYSFGAGSYAVVFKGKNQFNEFAIRCFISADQENIERYKNIDKYLKQVSASWITKTELLENEINVKGIYYPVIKMDWVEGQLLNNYLTQIVDNNSALTELQNEVIRVSKSLETLKIGHGDIQCGNIIIAKNAEGENIIKLIDYDGMYIPLFSSKTNLERGRTEFQHPNRSQIQYNEKIDRFSFWVILCAIEALKYDKTLWFEVMKGGFNTLDNLLFLGDDFKYFNDSKLVNRLYSLKNPSLNFYLDKLNKFCNSSPESVECPYLFESGNILETIESKTESLFNENNGEIQIITNPVGAVVLTSTFQRIGTTPLKIDRAIYLNKTIIISYETQIEQVQILQDSKIIDLTFSEMKHSETFNGSEHQEINTKNTLDSASTQLSQNIIGTEPEKSGWAVFGIIAALLIVLIIIVLNNIQSNEPTYISTDSTITESPDYAENPSVIFDSTVIEPFPTLDSASVVSQDTVEIEPPANIPENNTSLTLKDDYDLTAQEAVKAFLGALSKNDCDAAWNITYNPTWENKGKDWFCSSEAFGGTSKVLLGDIYPITQNFSEAEIYVEYYTEDIFNGNYCFTQNIIVKKFMSENNLRWMITKMINTQPPYPCKINEEIMR